MNLFLSCFVWGLVVNMLFYMSTFPIRRRFNGEGSDCYIQANISTNDAGIILAASNAQPPISGATVSRVHQKMSFTLGAKPTVSALLSLIHDLRVVKIEIILFQPDQNDGTQFTQSKVCIRLAQMALFSLESEKQAKGADCPCIEWPSVRNRA